MDFAKFADLMESIGFREDEPIAPTFSLNGDDLKNPVFRRGYPKMAGHYRVVSIWSQNGEVAFWSRKSRVARKLFPFFKEEVDFLVQERKFRKS